MSKAIPLLDWELASPNVGLRAHAARSGARSRTAKYRSPNTSCARTRRYHSNSADSPHLSAEAGGVSGCTAALKAAPGLDPAPAARTDRVRCMAMLAAAGNAAGALLPATKPPMPAMRLASFGSLPSLGASLSSPPNAAASARRDHLSNR